MSFATIPNTFVFRPGGVANGNVFTDWAKLMIAVGSVAGAKVVQVDSSLGAASAAVGTWDMTDVTLAGFEFKPPNPEVLSLPDGVVLHNLASITSLLVIALATTTPNFTVDNEHSLVIERGGNLDNQGTQPAIRLAANQDIVVALIEGTFTATTGALVDLPAAPATIVIATLANSNFNATNNVVTGIVGTFANFIFDAGIGVFPTNPGFLGGTAKTFVDTAPFVGYTPAVPADWSPVPAEVAAALDQLAARPSGAVVTLTFNASAANVLAAVPGLPAVGTLHVVMEGFGGTGGAGGGSGGAVGAGGNGGAGSGGCVYQRASFDHDLSHHLDIVVGAGGAGGAGGAAGGGAGGDGVDGSPSYAQDATTTTIHVSFEGSGKGFGANNVSFQDRAAGGPAPGLYLGPGFENGLLLQYYGGQGGGGGSTAPNGSRGAESLNVPAAAIVWLGGNGGTSVGTDGGGGGGGGAGPFANGGDGANGASGAGLVGGASTANAGNGAGGGSGGNNSNVAGGAGGNGAAGWLRLTFTVP